MQVTTVPPSPRLAPFVERFTIVESRDEVTRALLPEGGVIVGIRYAGAASLVDGDRVRRVADAAITGILGGVRQMRTHAGGGVVLAQFRATGAARFFREPLDALFGATRPLDDLVPAAEVRRAIDRTAAARDHAGRVAAVEGFLLERLRPEPADPIAAAAVEAIAAERGVLRIARLARALGISQDPLEKRFRRAVGATPKHLASLIRVRHAIALGQRGAPWARAAVEAGYFDQSHFIRDFRALTGASPTRFFRAGAYC